MTRSPAKAPLCAMPASPPQARPISAKVARRPSQVEAAQTQAFPGFATGSPSAPRRSARPVMTADTFCACLNLLSDRGSHPASNRPAAPSDPSSPATASSRCPFRQPLDVCRQRLVCLRRLQETVMKRCGACILMGAKSTRETCLVIPYHGKQGCIIAVPTHPSAEDRALKVRLRDGAIEAPAGMHERVARLQPIGSAHRRQHAGRCLLLPKSKKMPNFLRRRDKGRKCRESALMDDIGCTLPATTSEVPHQVVRPRLT